MKRFEAYLDQGFVPIQDIDFIYAYYQKQLEDLAFNPDPRLEGLKTEVNYMINKLNSKYTFEEVNGMLMVQLKGE